MPVEADFGCFWKAKNNLAERRAALPELSIKSRARGNAAMFDPSGYSSHFENGRGRFVPHIRKTIRDLLNHLVR